MALPIMTPEQRADALAKAKLANAERARVKAGLKAGTATLAEVIGQADENDAIARMKVSALLQGAARRGAGPRREGHEGKRHPGDPAGQGPGS
jgi:hypothetical protein